MAHKEVEDVVIPREHLEELYAEVRDLSGLGRSAAAVDQVVEFLFEVLGEPGAGNE